MLPFTVTGRRVGGDKGFETICSLRAGQSPRLLDYGFIGIRARFPERREAE